MGYRNSLVLPANTKPKQAWGGGRAAPTFGGKTLSAFVARDDDRENKDRFLTSYRASFVENAASGVRNRRAKPLYDVQMGQLPHMGQSKSEAFIRNRFQSDDPDSPMSMGSCVPHPAFNASCASGLRSLKDMGTRTGTRAISTAPSMSQRDGLGLTTIGEIGPTPMAMRQGSLSGDLASLKDRRRTFMELLANPDLEDMIRKIFTNHARDTTNGNLNLEDLCMVLRSLHQKLGIPNPEYEVAERIFKKFDTRNRQELNFGEFFELILALLRQNCFDRSTLLGRDFFVHKHDGSVWDRYDRVKKLGEGSFGTAFLAKQKFTGEHRVVKVVKKSRIQIPVEDVEREIMVMRQVDHPHIVRLRRWYEDMQRIYLVMDYCQGGTLRAVVLDFKNQQRGIKENWTRTVITHVLQAMAYCHSMRLIHKDLKDENIMLLRSADRGLTDDEPFAVIIDLGISEMFTPSDPQGRQAGGTPSMMAPEVWLGTFGPKCDVWSAGCVLYELLTGKMPFVASSLKPQPWIRLHKRGADFSLAKTSAASKALCQAMMTFDEFERPTMQECLEYEWFRTERRELQTVATAQFHNLQQFCKDSALKRGVLLEIASHLPMDDADRVVEVFNSFDENNDGMISYGELDQAFQRLGLKQKDDSLAKKVFKVLDLDGDGHLTFTEFCSLILVLFKDLLDDRLDKMMAEYSGDNDGALDHEGARKFLMQIGRTTKQDPQSRSSGIINDLLVGDRKIKFKEMKDKIFGHEEVEAPLTAAPFCTCGNKFMNDSAYCRKCGLPREKEAPAATVKEQARASQPPLQAAPNKDDTRASTRSVRFRPTRKPALPSISLFSRK